MIEKLKNKYLFIDIDGTLAEYRYDDKLYADKDPKIGSQNLNELLFGDLFYQARQLKIMQKLIEQLDPNKIYILGTILTNNEMFQKYKWIEKYYPTIKKENIIFISNTMLKPKVILEYQKHYSIPLENICFIDDRVDVLTEAELNKIKSYHISSFID